MLGPGWAYNRLWPSKALLAPWDRLLEGAEMKNSCEIHDAYMMRLSCVLMVLDLSKVEIGRLVTFHRAAALCSCDGGISNGVMTTPSVSLLASFCMAGVDAKVVLSRARALGGKLRHATCSLLYSIIIHVFSLQAFTQQSWTRQWCCLRPAAGRGGSRPVRSSLRMPWPAGASSWPCVEMRLVSWPAATAAVVR